MFSKNGISLIRPKQVVKNVFVLLPLFFSGHLLEMSYLVPSVIAFISFSLAASGIYCLNDIVDIKSDRLHPEKCQRPLASGSISTSSAVALMLLCFLSSFLILLLLPDNRCGCFIIVSIYIGMNVAYCLGLKKVALLDVFIIAFGFVLRVIIGGVSSSIETSHWILSMSFLLALFLAVAKRRDDVVLYESSGVKVRESSSSYSLQFLNQTMSLLATVALICYIMYTITDEVVERIGSPYLYATSVFVLAALLRYMQIAIVKEQSGSPTNVFYSDKFLQICVFCWIMSFAIMLYF